jgi:tetratricopeptide (TPR) repeat protein
VAGEHPRLLELRRRVQADPASIAFAQLAEECRRQGANDEAVGICRAGLARHPGYLSARVTLGRALIELDRLDEARAELDLVVATAPDNLAAIRGLAEIFQRKGQLETALGYYRRALMLARHDPDLEETVDRISQAIAPAPPPPPPAPAIRVEDLFDFDTLLAQLGEQAPEVQQVQPVQQVQQVLPVRPLLPEVEEQVAGAADAFASIERDLRAFEEHRAKDEAATRRQLIRQRQLAVLHDLETWLAAIVADRTGQSAR